MDRDHVVLVICYTLLPSELKEEVRVSEAVSLYTALAWSSSVGEDQLVLTSQTTAGCMLLPSEPCIFSPRVMDMSLGKSVWTGWKAKEHRCAFFQNSFLLPQSLIRATYERSLNLTPHLLPLSFLPPIVQDSSQWGREQWGLIVFCRYRGHQQRPAILGPGDPPYAGWNLFLLSWHVSFSVLACSLTSSCSETRQDWATLQEYHRAVQLSPASRTNRQPPVPISHPHNLMNRSGNL